MSWRHRSSREKTHLGVIAFLSFALFCFIIAVIAMDVSYKRKIHNLENELAAYETTLTTDVTGTPPITATPTTTTTPTTTATPTTTTTPTTATTSTTATTLSTTSKSTSESSTAGDEEYPEEGAEGDAGVM